MICKYLKQCCSDQQCKYGKKELCWIINAGSNVACAERNCRYSLQNPDHIEVRVFHVDGGLVFNDEACPKCDYLYEFAINSRRVVIFVELKGMDFGKALRQIENTIKLFAKVFNNYERHARIVCTRVPDIRNNPQDIKLLKSLEKAKIKVKKGTIDITEPISSF